MSTIIAIAVGAGGGLALLFGWWWTLLSLIALPRPRHAIAKPGRAWQLVVVVPAHNEERGLPACLRSLAATPFEPRPEVLVVADNCTDNTAAVAEQHGASVLERDDPANRGKGHALEFAIEHLAARDMQPDAVAFVDADTTVSADFYSAIAGRLDHGAEAVQVYYEAAVGPSGLSRLRRLAFMLIHWSRPLGASRLGLGTGLKGNGMAVRWELASAGLGSAGITEDASMTLALAERGVAVAFEPRASVEGYMAHSYDDAVTQDSRWEGGRIALWPTAMRAAANALLRGRVAAAAAALELASPPLSLLATVSALAVVVGTLTRSAALPVALAGAGSLLSYVTIGLIAARASWADVAALRFAPRFVVHKLIVLAQVVAGRSATTWQRTERR